MARDIPTSHEMKPLYKQFVMVVCERTRCPPTIIGMGPRHNFDSRKIEPEVRNKHLYISLLTRPHWEECFRSKTEPQAPGVLAKAFATCDTNKKMLWPVQTEATVLTARGRKESFPTCGLKRSQTAVRSKMKQNQILISYDRLVDSLNKIMLSINQANMNQSKLFFTIWEMNRGSHANTLDMFLEESSAFGEGRCQDTELSEYRTCKQKNHTMEKNIRR